MTKLECSIKNCLHNVGNYCCKVAIAVDGNKAKTAEQTCCASFDENEGDEFINLFKTPEIRLEIVCDAVKCVHDEEHRCSAERIDISGDGACGCTETRCGTFKVRQIQNQDGCVRGRERLAGNRRAPPAFYQWQDGDKLGGKFIRKV